MSHRQRSSAIDHQSKSLLLSLSLVKHRGFTLIELLLVVGILAVVFGLALPFALNTKFTNELDTATENLITTLREAQSQAIAAEGDTPYGVYFDSSSSPQKYTIYRGASWASKDESFNVGGYGTTELPKSATLKFNWPVPDTTTPSETTFARLTGKIIDVSDVSTGTSWTARNSAADNRWTSVTYGNGLFVAVACGVNSIMCNGTVGNRIMTSPDGIAWTLRNSPANYSWTSITYGNGLFVAVANSGTGDRVMTSPDGIAWTPRNSAADNAWNSVAYGNGLFVATAINGTGNKVMTSPNGIDWTLRASAADNYWWNSVTYGNGLFVAVTCGLDVFSLMCNTVGDKVMTSPDGIAWTLINGSANNEWASVTYGNGLFVAVANSGTGDRVMTSGKLNALYREIKISIPDIGSKDIKVTTEGLIY